MPRILIVTNIFPPLIGGPATFADRLAHVLSARGHKVTIVCSSSGASDPADATRPFRVVRIPIGNRYAYEVKVRTALVRELATHKRILVAGLESYVYDAVRAVPRHYVLRVPGDTVWENARNYGVTSGDFDTFQKSGSVPEAVRGIADRRSRYLARARTIVCPSDYLCAVVRRWPGTPPDLRTIRNGIEITEYPQSPRKARGNNPLRVLFVGRLTNWKGVETLLLAAQGLKNVEVAIIGDGPEAPLLMELSAQLRTLGAHVPIRFLGRMSTTQVREQMLAHDVLALPSGYEGLSHTLLEGCAAGLVPVATTIGGNMEVIQHGVHGLLFAYGHVMQLREALENLRDNDQLRLKLSDAARRRAADFPFSATVDAYAALLEENGA